MTNILRGEAGDFHVQIIDGEHSHEPIATLVHPSARRSLLTEARQNVLALTRAGVTPDRTVKQKTMRWPQLYTFATCDTQSAEGC